MTQHIILYTKYILLSIFCCNISILKFYLYTKLKSSCIQHNVTYDDRLWQTKKKICLHIYNMHDYIIYLCISNRLGIIIVQLLIQLVVQTTTQYYWNGWMDETIYYMDIWQNICCLMDFRSIKNWKPKYGRC